VVTSKAHDLVATLTVVVVVFVPALLARAQVERMKKKKRRLIVR
jgi:hypothetical protein